MKKIIAAATAATFALSLTACESQAEEETEAAAEVLDEQAELVISGLLLRGDQAALAAVGAHVGTGNPARAGRMLTRLLLSSA